MHIFLVSEAQNVRQVTELWCFTTLLNLSVVRAINILSLFYEDKKKCLETADKLWFGIGKKCWEKVSADFVCLKTKSCLLLHFLRTLF